MASRNAARISEKVYVVPPKFRVIRRVQTTSAPSAVAPEIPMETRTSVEPAAISTGHCPGQLCEPAVLPETVSVHIDQGLSLDHALSYGNCAQAANRVPLVAVDGTQRIGLYRLSREKGR